MSDVREINRIELLGDCRAAWDGLLAQTPGTSFFHSLDWLEIYWRHYGSGQRLRVLTVETDGRIVGIVPLVVRREQTRIGPLRVLTYPLHDWGSFFGPVGPDPEGTLTASLEYVLRDSRDWDLLELRWIDPGSIQAKATARAMEAAGLPVRPIVWDRTAVIEMQGSWDEYWADRPSKWRSNLRRDGRLLARQGRVQYVRYRPAGESQGDCDPRWDLYEACERVAERSWQGSSPSGTTLTHGSVRAFFRQAHEAAIRRGEVDLNLLQLDGQPLAFAYNYHSAGRVYGLRMGYDESVSRHGPGNCLLDSTIRDCFARGDTFYDLGVKSLDCKRHFATGVVPIHRLSYFRPASPRAQIVRIKRWIQEYVDRTEAACERKPLGISPMR